MRFVPRITRCDFGRNRKKWTSHIVPGTLAHHTVNSNPAIPVSISGFGVNFGHAARPLTLLAHIFHHRLPVFSRLEFHSFPLFSRSNRHLEHPTTMAARIDALLAQHSAASIPEEPQPGPSAAPSLTYSDSSDEHDVEEPRQPEPRQRRASTRLIAQSPADVQRITGETTTQLIKRCCGGGCCFGLGPKKDGVKSEPIDLPDNEAYRSLELKITQIPTTLNGVCDLPEQTAFLQPLRRPSSVPSPTGSSASLSVDGTTSVSGVTDVEKKLHNLALEDLDTRIQPPSFVQPHPPHHVFAARLHNTRELTRPGAEKRTFHFDLDVTNYPEGEGGRLQGRRCNWCVGAQRGPNG